MRTACSALCGFPDCCSGVTPGRRRRQRHGNPRSRRRDDAAAARPRELPGDRAFPLSPGRPPGSAAPVGRAACIHRAGPGVVTSHHDRCSPAFTSAMSCTRALRRGGIVSCTGSSCSRSISTNSRRSRAVCRCSRSGGANLFSFRDRDYLPIEAKPDTPAPAARGARPAKGGEPSLKDRVTAYAATHGVDVRGGRVILVTLPRIAGYLFNPVSFYFCYDRSRGAGLCDRRGHQHLS
jgi:hypothetical protein